jgi:hypothetical protein
MRLLAGFLALWMAMPIGAQTPSGMLNLVVVEGEGAINNIRQRTAREPVVQVEDENHKPVAGAAVVFTLPSSGASGTFANGARTLTVLTDQNGRAVAHGFRANSIAGKFQIHVTASQGGRVATVTISQTNVAAAAGAAGAGAAAGVSLKTIGLVVAVAGAAAAGGIVAATRGSNNAATPASVTITPGTGTVGAPR